MKRKLIRILGLVLGVIFSLGLLFWAIGTQIPEKHEETIAFEISEPPKVVWSVLTDYAAYPRWWPDLISTEKEVLSDGTEIWWDSDKNGEKVGIKTLESVKPTRLVREVVDQGQPYGGQWIFLLEPTEQGTQVTLTERGFIRSPLFRFIVKYFFGYRMTIESFAQHFKTYFEEEDEE